MCVCHLRPHPPLALQTLAAQHPSPGNRGQGFPSARCIPHLRQAAVLHRQQLTQLRLGLRISLQISLQISNRLKPASGTEAHSKALRGRIRLLVIGSSTGGPMALTEVLMQLSAGFSVPIVVVQHMPPNFTKALAERLDRQCQVQG